MQQISPRVFGKRNAPLVPAPPKRVAGGPGRAHTAAVEAPKADHAAFFASIRTEVERVDEPHRLIVPWSFKAASLTGLVIGCALVGFDVTGQAGATELQAVTGLLGVHVDAGQMLPAMIAMGLLAGGRVATATLLSVHLALAGIGRTSHLAYALGGAMGSVGFAALALVLAGHMPEHGWSVEIMSGMGAGLCYRAIAGARAADASTSSN